MKSETLQKRTSEQKNLLRNRSTSEPMKVRRCFCYIAAAATKKYARLYSRLTEAVQASFAKAIGC